MEQIIPDNENIEDYFTGDEIDMWNSLEDSYEFETLGELRGALTVGLTTSMRKVFQRTPRCNIPQLTENYTSRCILFL